ncbi:hypothetical protein [Propionivibrio sp.]
MNHLSRFLGSAFAQGSRGDRGPVSCFPRDPGNAVRQPIALHRGGLAHDR